MSVTDLERLIDEAKAHELLLLGFGFGVYFVILILGLWKLLELEWLFLNFLAGVLL